MERTEDREAAGRLAAVTGRIEASSASSVSLRTANGKMLEIAYDDIELARLVVDF